LSTPFDEPVEAELLEVEEEVESVEFNYHAHLIAPGGFWKVTRLSK